MTIILPRLYLFFCISAFTCVCYSQTSKVQFFDIEKSIDEGKNYSRSEVSGLSASVLSNFLTNYPYYINEKRDSRNRLRSYRFLYLVGLEQSSLSSRVVTHLVSHGLWDENPGNRESVCSFLESFSPQAFTSATSNQVSSVVLEQKMPSKQISFLAARLNIESLIPYFENLLNQKDLSMSTKWYLNVTLGRYGDDDAVLWCLNQIERTGMNDMVILALIPDLVFTRNKNAIDFLLESILSDEQNCSSPNLDSDAKITCAYRLMELVAPAISDFPFQVDAAGQLDTNDYEKALVVVREWISEKKDDYSIVPL